MFCRGWLCGEVGMPAPRFIAVDGRVGEGGVGALVPPGDEVNEIFRGVTVGSARWESSLSGSDSVLNEGTRSMRLELTFGSTVVV